MSNNVEIKTNVDFKQTTDAVKEVQKLREELATIGSMATPVNTRFDQMGSAAMFRQQNDAIKASIDRLFKSHSNPNITAGPNGSRTYTSPGGVQYRLGPQEIPNTPEARQGSEFIPRPLKHLLWGAAGITGVGEIFGGLSRGMEVYKQTVISEGQLLARGGRSGARIAWGFGPMDVVAQDLEAARLMGDPQHAAARGNLYRMSSRAFGMDSPSAIADFMASYYRATGQADVKKQTETLGRMYELQKKTSAFVSAENFISDSRRVLAAVQSGVGTGTQINNGLGIAQSILASMYRVTGIGANAAGMFEKANRGLVQGGTDIGSKTLAWAALGGFEGQMTPERYLALNMEREKGLSSKTYLPGLKKIINRMGHNDASKISMFMGQMQGLTYTEAVPLWNYVNSPNYDKAVGEGLSFEAGANKYGSDAVRKAASKAMANEGGRQNAVEAAKQMKEYDLGKAIKPTVDQFSSAVNRFISQVLEGGLKELPKSLSRLVDTMGPVGVAMGALAAATAVKSLGEGGTLNKALGWLKDPKKAIAGGANPLAIAALSAAFGLYQGGKAAITGRSDINDLLEKYLPLGEIRDNYSKKDVEITNKLNLKKRNEERRRQGLPEVDEKGHHIKTSSADHVMGQIAENTATSAKAQKTLLQIMAQERVRLAESAA